MTKKTKEELEREQALEQINQVLDSSAPKNLGQGLTRGVGNIVQGAVGAVGIAVLLPTLGLGMGMKNGGLLGGIVGLTGGAVVGALGAVVLAVGGVFSGVSQIVRGVVAVPQSVMAPRQGKWWNENEGHWVLTDMEKEAKALEGIPEDDDDILGKIKNELDESMVQGPKAGEVVDMYYYEVLEVPCDAEPSVIKRRYYVLARQYHPDRVGADDKEAAEKFKEIAEAYQVLSDPELRAKYDTDGRDGLSADKTAVAEGPAGVDPDIFFAFLFGSDLFYDYFGRFATATSASVGDSPKVSVADARKLQKRRVTRLALKLITRISPWVALGHAGEDCTAAEGTWMEEAMELTKASYGYELVTTIGKAYNVLAIMSRGTADGGSGLPGVAKWAAAQKASLDGRQFENKQKMDQLRAGLDMMKLQQQLQKKMAEAKTDEEKQKVQQELEDATLGIVLRILWTTAVVDITTTLYETCQMVFYDQSVDKETRDARVNAVEALGKVFMEVPEPETTDADKKDAKKLYEEAAFAAMLETVKRKDEAQYGHKSG